MPNSWQANDVSRLVDDENDPVGDFNLDVHVCTGNASDKDSFALVDKSEGIAEDSPTKAASRSDTLPTEKTSIDREPEVSNKEQRPPACRFRLEGVRTPDRSAAAIWNTKCWTV